MRLLIDGDGGGGFIPSPLPTVTVTPVSPTLSQPVSVIAVTPTKIPPPPIPATNTSVTPDKGNTNLMRMDNDGSGSGGVITAPIKASPSSMPVGSTVDNHSGIGATTITAVAVTTPKPVVNVVNPDSATIGTGRGYDPVIITASGVSTTIPAPPTPAIGVDPFIGSNQSASMVAAVARPTRQAVVADTGSGAATQAPKPPTQQATPTQSATASASTGGAGGVPQIDVAAAAPMQIPTWVYFVGIGVVVLAFYKGGKF